MSAVPSTSVRVRCEVLQRAPTLANVSALLSSFGDLARVDLSLAAKTGFVSATFFDVRSADRALAHLEVNAEPTSPEECDFRSLVIPKAVLLNLPSSFAGFHIFGDVERTGLRGEEMVLDFFDMRSAQLALRAIPGCKPRPQAMASVRQELNPFQLQHGLRSDLVPSAMDAMPADWRAASQTGSEDQGHVCGDALVSAVASLLATSSTMGSSSVIEADPVAAVAPAPASAPPLGEEDRRAEARRPVDYSQLEVIPAKLRSGEETRTTVMLRNIPKSCSPEQIEDVLWCCGLSGRYDVLHVPTDQRRNLHCGFAFVNLLAPSDVLQLCESIQTSWASLFPRQEASGPGLSFARTQGREGLVRHFNNGPASARSPLSASVVAPEAHSRRSVGSMEPKYITPLADLFSDEDEATDVSSSMLGGKFAGA